MIPSPQYDNYLMSSILLWLDNRILTSTSGFYNTNTSFFPIRSPYANYQCYASPFGQFVADSSINGATIGSGVYINSIFKTTGQGGLTYIDYNNGRIYTTGLSSPSISGMFGIKYFNIKLTDEQDEKILIETAYKLRPKTLINATGLQDDYSNYPVIFIKSDGGFNAPFTFGGLETTINNVRLFVVTDSSYSLDCINTCIRNSYETYIPILSQGHFPFNSFGDFKSGDYNYTNLTNPIKENGEMAFINEVYITKYNQNYIEIKKLNPNVYWSIIELEIEKHRYPRYVQPLIDPFSNLLIDESGNFLVDEFGNYMEV